ncbi:hypothetical protein VC83_08270 [Pseudogymnoascus destructans]|uniref:Uncharacterized protein n=1 Tax=Pseudogymnoascus destructans TaxID=655981 RepID=A0A177A1S0_9PEZI|nr:uncharacterized protein VC83_08270 [Pseudogymnoascus destructans]OAF55432.1 hypothetical protein VC83_08270 [Pseudogymnoascus destructans]
MAPREAKPNVQRVGKRPQGIDKGRPHRKSARLKNLERRQERTIPGDTNTHRALFPRVKENPSEPLKAENRKRRRPQESESPLSGALSNSVRKRPRTSVTSSFIGDKSSQVVACKYNINPIDYWRRKGRWPEEYSKQDDQTRKGINKDFEDRRYETYRIPEANMNHLLARRKSSSSLRGKQSEASSTTPSDQNPREAKSTTYARPVKDFLASRAVGSHGKEYT